MMKKKAKTAQAAPLAERVFALLLGSWAIEREIRPKGRFRGSATFSRVDARTLAYAEEGDLVLDEGGEMRGERRQTYILHENRIEIRFADGLNAGEHFVDINFPADPSANWPICSGDTHLCLLDTYKATFCFETEDEFSITYEVCGPAKDYVSSSVYRRLKALNS